MAVTVAEVCDGIQVTLSVAPGLQSSTTYDELTEGIATFDCPRLEIYPQSGVCDPSGSTDRTTFNACVQQLVLTIHADLYARQRSELGEDMKAYVDLVDSIIDILQTQQRPPFFGVAGIKAFSWRWVKSVFRRAEARYAGARFVITCKIF